jgi:hypothetical protein
MVGALDCLAASPSRDMYARAKNEASLRRMHRDRREHGRVARAEIPLPHSPFGPRPQEIDRSP